MPDISKIKLENDIYNIKDATARANLETLESSVQSIETITQAEVDQITSDAFDSFPSPVYGYDTVADMQADPDLQEEMICHTSGFHKAGDGGAAYYKISNSGTANGMDVLACGDLFATLIITGPYVTPEMFGAYGDRMHDDVASFTKALDYGLSFVAAEKTYLLSEAITVSSCDFTCHGQLKFSNDSNCGIMIADLDHHTVLINEIIGYSNTDSGSVALTINSSSYNYISVNYMSNFSVGILMSDSSGGTFRNKVDVRQNSCLNGLVFSSSGSGWVNGNDIDFLYFPFTFIGVNGDVYAVDFRTGSSNFYNSNRVNVLLEYTYTN